MCTTIKAALQFAELPNLPMKTLWLWASLKGLGKMLLNIFTSFQSAHF
jgi:hypothetical protein